LGLDLDYVVKDVLLTVVGALRTLLLPMRPNSWDMVFFIIILFWLYLIGYI